MNDSMQFGPEWLRNLSQHDDENTMVTPKYQLAEHRYGREEMLALFDRSVVAPDPLRSISGLYMEKLQLPLALIQMSELETRVWNSNVNNDTSQRNVIKSGPVPVPIISQSGGNLSMSRGRGISVDRGKSRSSRGPHHYNHRNYSEEGADTSHTGTAFGRSRIFERSQSHYNERNWTERNGNIDYGEWNGYNNTPENGLSTSPRKDFATSTRLTSSREDTNWRRRPNIKDEDDSWRSNKYGRSGYYWRESGERDREKEKDFEGQEMSKDRRWMSRVSNMHSLPNRYDSETKDDCLPEWATESPNEGGGTFDSSGAFHGTHSDDEEAMQENDCKLPKDAEKVERKTKNDPCNVYGSEKINRSKAKLTTCDQKNKTKDKSISLIEMLSSQTIKSIESSQQHSDAYPLTSPSSKSTVSKPSTCQLQESNSMNIPSLSSKVDYYDAAGESGKVYNIIENTAASELQTQIPSQAITKQLQQLQHEAFQQLNSKMEYISTNHGVPMTSAFDPGFNATPMNSNILQNLNENDFQTGSLINKSLTTSPDVDGRISSMHQKNDDKSELTPTMNKLVGLKNFNSCRRTKEEDLNCIVGDVVSKFMAETEEEVKSKKLDGMNKWYYRDPQGQVQGPFPNTEMAEWFKLGYFHDKSLIVRRACEDNYYPLHDLVTYLNGSPFETVTPENFRKYSQVTLPNVQLSTISNTHTLPPIPMATNVPDESFLLSQMQQHYQTSLPYEALYARQQQIIAAKKRQLLQSPDGIKSLFDHQELMSRHMVGTVDANSGASCGSRTTLPQSALPMVPGYIHPVVPSTVPSPSDPNFVMMLNQMQHQQHVHQQLLQQQIQRHHHQQQPLLPPQRLKNIKSDQLQQLPSSQPELISYLDDSVQQLVHKMSTLSSAKQIPPVPAPNSPLLPPCSSSDTVQTEGFSLASEEKTEPTNVIQNLLKQLGVNAEKKSKPADSIWGTSSISAPNLNNSSFNAQNWCSQVGKIGPTPPSNAGTPRLWMQDNTLPTATMITEQEIIETFMKSMQLQRDDSKKEAEEKVDLPKKEEEPILLQEAEKKKGRAKVEKEKRKKQQEDAGKNCKIAEQTQHVVEDAKRKEEKWRKAEEKLKREEHKVQDRVAEEEKKQYDVQSQDLDDMHQKQVDAMKRLKQQQAAATEASKSQKLASSFVPPTDQKPLAVSRAQKSNVSAGSYGKQTGNITSVGSVSDMKTNKVVAGKDNVDLPLRNQQTASSKQTDKSKPVPSVAISNQKAVNGEKKAQEKKKKDKTSTNAWADQKKIPQVKSLAEIQAEEQKKLAKQIEKEKQERLLQQQQATVNTKSAKEAAKFNIWKSQNQPWKNNWASVPPALANNSNSIQGMPENVSSRQSNSASASITNASLNCGGGNKSSVISNVNVVSNQQVPSNKNDEPLDNVAGNDMNHKNKSKKDGAASKKTLSSSSASVTTMQANLKSDELSRWSVKTLSSLKVSVDVPTFIGFLREVESPSDVMEYVTDYLGDGKEIKNFVKQFLEKRSAGSFITLPSSGTVKKLKNKKSAGEENPSLGNKRKEEEKSQINRTNSGEFLEVKAKSKKSTRKKVMRVDTALLGFNVTAAPDRINIGERDMGEDVY